MIVLDTHVWLWWINGDKTRLELPEHHRDPQDRLIIATALAHCATLLSADEKFSLYRELDQCLLS